MVSLITFLNHFCRLEPFSALDWILIEIKPLSLEFSRNMFKRQNNGAIQITSKIFIEDA